MAEDTRAEIDAAHARLDEEERIAAEMADTPDGDVGEAAGRSIEDLADDPVDQEELFPLGSLEGDEKVTHKTLIRKGLPVQVTVSIRKAEVPLRGEGLLSPYRTGRVLMHYIYRGQNEVALHEDSDSPADVTGWKIRQELQASKVIPADDEYELIESEFAALLLLDRSKAGRLLDSLKNAFVQDDE